MPDLDTMTAFTCSSNEFWSHEVQSGDNTYVVRWSKQPRSADVQYDWSCTCKGFQFRHQCKHIEAVKHLRCGWNAELEPTAQPDSGGPDNRPVCPNCGADVVPVRVGV